jgi:NADH-quinone oxidoreductase subunit H
MDWIQTHIPPWVWIAIVVHLVVMGTVAYLILLERKVASWVQDRIGPNRVGLGFGIIPFLKDKKMFGLGQPMADGLKFLFKEDYRPAGVDKILFTVGPMIMIVVVIISIAVIPWGGVKQKTRMLEAGQTAADVVPASATIVAQTADSVTYQYPFQIANIDIGVLFVLAILSLGVYGVVIGGWASNNKYSFLGGLRATANMISYEIPLGLCVLCIVIMFGSLDLAQITNVQTGYWLGFIPKWNVFVQPIAFFLFLVCIHAEANRAPFDLAEAEQELVGGYHTEYSSMRFALFFLSEYAGMITTSCVLVALFFGGWHLPWLEWIPFLSQTPEGAHKSVTTSLFVCILRAAVLFTKAAIVLFVFMWVRWSLPRFRFDQLMNVAWRGLIPITLALVAGTTILVYLTGGRTMDENGVTGRDAIVFLVMNVAIVFAVFAAAMILPAAPDTNRKIHVAGSRYSSTPLPAGTA